MAERVTKNEILNTNLTHTHTHTHTHILCVFQVQIYTGSIFTSVMRFSEGGRHAADWIEIYPRVCYPGAGGERLYGDRGGKCLRDVE